MRVVFSRSLHFLNYLPITAPDYHPFANRKGMHYSLIWIFLPNTYHFEIVLLPNTIPGNPTPFFEIQRMKLLLMVQLPEYSIME